MESNVIKFTEKDYASANKFADARIAQKTNYAARSGQDDLRKVRVNILQGALAEIAFYRFFKSLGYDCSKPDFKIYPVGEKSYGADLVCKNKDIHIKSCGTSEPEISFVYTIGEEPKSGYSGFVVLGFRWAKILGLAKVEKLKNLYKPTRKKMKESKTALYWNDISTIVRLPCRK